jgi:hypothetical protein
MRAVQFANAPRNRELCHLYSAEGRSEECLESGCSFWEPGTAVLEPGCALERLGLPRELERNPQLVHWLLKVRTRLDERHEREEQRQFLMPLPPGLRD